MILRTRSSLVRQVHRLAGRVRGDPRPSSPRKLTKSCAFTRREYWIFSLPMRTCPPSGGKVLIAADFLVLPDALVVSSSMIRPSSEVGSAARGFESLEWTSTPLVTAAPGSSMTRRSSPRGGG